MVNASRRVEHAPTGKEIGIDLGLKEFLTDSEGNTLVSTSNQFAPGTPISQIVFWMTSSAASAVDPNFTFDDLLAMGATGFTDPINRLAPLLS